MPKTFADFTYQSTAYEICCSMCDEYEEWLDGWPAKVEEEMAALGWKIVEKNGHAMALCPDCVEFVKTPLCSECENHFDDNPGKKMCKTCEDFIVTG